MPHEDKSNLEDLVAFLKEKSEEAKAFYSKCKQLEAKLEAVDSTEGYDSLISEVINLQNELSHFLGANIQGLEEKEFASLEDRIRLEQRLSFFPTLIHFDETVKQKIITAKERLSLYELQQSLPPNKAREALAFINGIKSLEDTARLIRQQTEDFRIQVQHAQSEGELNGIDAAISQMSKTLHKVIEQHMPYPSDEATATALVKYLERNPEVNATLKAFDVEGNLTDDTLYARSAMASKH